MKKKTFINALKAIKNELDPEAKTAASAVESLITELENSEELVSYSDLEAKLKETLTAYKPAEEVENNIFLKVKNMVDNMGKQKAEATYLKTANSVKDFARCIKNAKSGEDFAQMWGAKLTENGISGVVYPEEVSKAIENAWNAGAGLFSKMRKVSSKEFKVMYTTDDTDTTYARGHQKGATKTQQSFETLSKKISLQMVYKWIPVDRLDLIAMEDNAAFINFITTELSDRLQSTLERVVIAGEWRSGADAITSFESIGNKSAGDAWTNFATIAANDAEALRKEIFAQSFGIESKGKAKWLYVAKSVFASLCERIFAAGGSTNFVIKAQLETELGFERIIPVDYLGANAGDAVAVIVTPDLYYRVGGEPFGENWSIYEKNQEAYMVEVAAGGAIGGLKSTAVIKIAE